MKRLQPNSTRRNRKGSAIAEFGPAFIFFVLFLFFPAIDLLGLGLTYFSCNVLNDLQVSQARLVSADVAKSENGPVMLAEKNWSESGLGQFVNPVAKPETKVTYREGQEYADGRRDVYVIVTTTVQCRPFVNMPMFKGIPGLGSPMTFTFAKDAFCEHPSLLRGKQS